MADDPELDVLLHESTQLHQSIEWLSGRILGLFGVVLPGAVVLFGFLARDSPEEASSPIASVALVGVVALVVVYAGSLCREHDALLVAASCPGSGCDVRNSHLCAHVWPCGVRRLLGARQLEQRLVCGSSRAVCIPIGVNLDGHAESLGALPEVRDATRVV